MSSELYPYPYLSLVPDHEGAKVSGGGYHHAASYPCPYRSVYLGLGLGLDHLADDRPSYPCPGPYLVDHGRRIAQNHLTAVRQAVSTNSNN